MSNPIRESITSLLYRGAGRTRRVVEAEYDSQRQGLVQAGPGPTADPTAGTGPQTSEEPDPETGDAISKMEKHLADINQIIASMDEFKLSSSQVIRFQNVGENMRAASQDVEYVLQSIGQGGQSEPVNVTPPPELPPGPPPEDDLAPPSADFDRGPPTPDEKETLGVGFP